MNNQTPNQILLDGSTQQQKVLDNAIERVQLAYEIKKGEPLYVAFSGGKDSVVLRGIVEEAAEKNKIPLKDYAEFHYSVTGVDPPELIYFMWENFPDLNWNMYKKSMWRLIEDRGIPTRLIRFCCSELKEIGGENRMCLTGVRWAESVKRSKGGAYEKPGKNIKNRILFNDNDAGRRLFENCIKKQKLITNPIIDFTRDNVWQYIKDRNKPYCSLYDEGFDRLGCVGCPMAGKGRIKEFERWPKYKINYTKAFERFLQKDPKKYKDKYGWETGQDIFDWWMEEKNLDKQTDGQMEIGELK